VGADRIEKLLRKRASITSRIFKSKIPLRNHAFGLLDYSPDNSQIVERFMNSGRNKPGALRDLAVGIFLRRTTQILLHTLQIPLKLLQRDQSRLCTPLMGLHRIVAQNPIAFKSVDRTAIIA